MCESQTHTRRKIEERDKSSDNSFRVPRKKLFLKKRINL